MIASRLRSPPSRDGRFPRGFVWGVAMSAPQIEGSAARGGKGESIWDRFALEQPDRIRGGATPDGGCEHYRLYRRDFALMASLGIRHYRLSIAWTRIYPDGDGAVNRVGVDHYHRVIDALQEYGITPWVCLFHWDLPQALEERGGWRKRLVADAFARYADEVVRSYGDRVKRWLSVNEIGCFTGLAYGRGIKAPGVCESARVVNQTYHHALLCHGHAVRAVREHGGRGAHVGFADNPTVTVPVTEIAADIRAARKSFVEANWRVLDPILRGRYAEGYLRAAGCDRPVVERDDFALISAPVDFVGLNIYTGRFVRAAAKGRAEAVALPPNYPRADSRWLHLVPQAVYWGARHVHDLYGVRTLYITENGAGYDETDGGGAPLDDLHRREYVRLCLHEVRRAIADGVPVRGYFLWSFLDNFEWEDGYARRFGIVHVDFATQKRTPKLSAHWYASVLKENRVL